MPETACRNFVLNEEHSGSKKTFSGVGRPGLVSAQRRSCGRAFFLHRIIAASERYTPQLISLSTSARDPNSTRLSSPASWFKSAKQSKGIWHGLEYRHVGAELTELEFQRLSPAQSFDRAIERI
jgi:hypothetical protein